MPSTLTEAQQSLLEARRLPEADRPSYLYALTGEQVVISSEMEDFAILIDGDVREEVIDRLREAVEINDDFNELLGQAVGAAESDANARLSDYVSALDGFNAFRTRLLKQPNAGSFEVGLIQHDVRRAQDRLVEEHDALFHDRQMAGLVLDVHTENENNPQAEAQRASWPAVLEMYA